MRIFAVLAVCLTIAALAALGLARRRASDWFTENVPGAAFADSPGPAAAESALLLCGLLAWVSIAVSRGAGEAAASRTASSFLMPLSPIVVLVCITCFMLVPQWIVPRGGGVFTALIVGWASSVACVILLDVCSSRRGISLLHPVGKRFLGPLPRGLRTGLIAYLLLRPLMFVADSLLVLAKLWADKPLYRQPAVERLLSYKGPAFLAVALGVIVITPVLEEILFRRFFYGSLRRHFGVVGAALLSAAAFAALHTGPEYFPQLFVLGIFLAVAYEKTQTLYAPIVLHALVNAGTVVLIALLRAAG